MLISRLIVLRGHPRPRRRPAIISPSHGFVKTQHFVQQRALCLHTSHHSLRNAEIFKARGRRWRAITQQGTAGNTAVPLCNHRVLYCDRSNKNIAFLPPVVFAIRVWIGSPRRVQSKELSWTVGPSSAPHGPHYVAPGNYFATTSVSTLPADSGAVTWDERSGELKGVARTMVLCYRDIICSI